MLGAIIGDIVGSRFEFNNTDQTDFELFAPECSFTDDTVCTIAVADAIMREADFGATLREWCRKYPSPKGGYGAAFVHWVQSDDPRPYNSFGNGSAMRVSPCGYMNSKISALKFARESAQCTHNHPEGIKGAMCVANIISLAMQGTNRKAIKALVTERYGYDIKTTCAAIRATNTFNESCQITVPQAIVAFLEGKDFETAIRLAVSLGGDSDTIAAIAGSMAEALYGIPQPLEEAAMAYLPAEFIDVITRFRAQYKYMTVEEAEKNKQKGRKYPRKPAAPTAEAAAPAADTQPADQQPNADQPQPQEPTAAAEG